MSTEDRMEDPDLYIQSPPTSPSERQQRSGTYGGRRQWQSSPRTKTKTKGTTTTALSTRSRKNPNVTEGMISSYLTSLGVSTSDETQMIHKEANEVSLLRRDYDTLKNERQKKEAALQTMEEELLELKKQNHCRQHDTDVAKTSISQFEKRAKHMKKKLDDEQDDHQVYKHMIARLVGEVQDGKKDTSERESRLAHIATELHGNSVTLLSIQQEKAAVDLLIKNLERQRERDAVQNERALRDVEGALVQTKKKVGIVERREQSRMAVMTQAVGDLNLVQSKKLKSRATQLRLEYHAVVAQVAEAEHKTQLLESDFRQVAEAAGTTDVASIVAKYLAREDTRATLRDELSETESRMKKLREKNQLLKEQLGTMRGMIVNTRGVYFEMDDTANSLKEIEKESLGMSEKYNRLNVVLDSCKACMIKCLTKIESVRGVHDTAKPERRRGTAVEPIGQTNNLDGPNQASLPESPNLTSQSSSSSSETRGSEASVVGLVHTVEQKLNRVIDKITIERAELELHRSEAQSQGLLGTTTEGSLNPNAEPTTAVVDSNQLLPHETEEHFILRMSKPDVSKNNVRVGPVAKRSPFEMTSSSSTSNNNHTHPSGDYGAVFTDSGVEEMAGEMAGDHAAVFVPSSSSNDHESTNNNPGVNHPGNTTSSSSSSNNETTTTTLSCLSHASQSLTDEDQVIDRHTRKKLASTIISNRGQKKKAF